MHIVCPLEFERSALRALGRRRGVVLHCTGPGPAAVEAWAREAGPPRGSLVVLAGVAGGLDAGIAAGSAVEAMAVLDGDRAEVRPAAPTVRCTALPAVRIVAVRVPLADADAKRATRERTGADAVDLESAAFAREAAARGWRWSVVRGISDGALDALPAGVAGWTDARGRTRADRVAIAVVRRPAIVPQLVRLGADSRRAMAAVAAALGQAIESNGGSNG